MIKQLIVFYLLQIVLTVGTIFLFGWLISICNRLFYKKIGSNSKLVCYVTGFIGTPIHELSHALFCVIFGHRIEEIKLFQINSADGTLGYVKHSYNPKNIYHRLGSFFIGVAPVLVISTIMYLLAKLICPSMLDLIITQSEKLNSLNIKSITSFIIGMVKAIFEYANTVNWWIFIIVGAFLSLHMAMSAADMKGALSGLVFVLALILLADVFLAIIDFTVFSRFVLAFLGVAGVLNTMLTLSLIVSIVLVILAYIVQAVLKKLFKKIV